MKYKGIILENYKQYKKGDLIDCIVKENYIYDKKNTELNPKSLYLIKENLSSQDEEKIKKIIKEFLKKVFWRLYTRNSFVLD